MQGSVWYIEGYDEETYLEVWSRGVEESTANDAFAQESILL